MQVTTEQAGDQPNEYLEQEYPIDLSVNSRRATTQPVSVIHNNGSSSGVNNLERMNPSSAGEQNARAAPTSPVAVSTGAFEEIDNDEETEKDAEEELIDLVALDEADNQSVASANSNSHQSEIPNAVLPNIAAFPETNNENATEENATASSSSLPTQPSTEAMEVDGTETDEQVKETDSSADVDQPSTIPVDNDNIALISGNIPILVEEGRKNSVSVGGQFDNVTADSNYTIFFIRQSWLISLASLQLSQLSQKKPLITAVATME